MPETTTQQEREALSPCPFCGSTELRPANRGKYYVSCNACGCFGPGPQDRGGASVQWEITHAEINDAWNRRATLPQRDEPVEEGKAEHVAWLRYQTHGGFEPTIHLCDSDAPGAFKVYTTPPSPSLREVQADAEPMTRFCPGCGSIGPVESKYRDCCPDGSHARVVPQKFAEHCRDLFKLALKGAYSEEGGKP